MGIIMMIVVQVFWIRIRIRIQRVHKFMGLPDPDPLVIGMDSDPDWIEDLYIEKSELMFGMFLII
jgi:hypothetical protein